MNARLAIAAAVCCAPSVLAQVVVCHFSKAASYEQVADDTPPTEAYTWASHGELIATKDTDAATAEIGFNGLVNPVILEPVGKGYPIFRAFGGYFVTACHADFDGDGFVSGIDFDEFVEASEAGDEAADFDDDGFITGIDFDSFVLAYETGCN